MDEVFANSVYSSKHCPEPTPFTSVLSLDIPTSFKDRLHVLSAPTKDLGLSGLKAGLLISENQQLLQLMRVAMYATPISGGTDAILSPLLDDTALAQELLQDNKRLLTRAANMLGDWLTFHKLPYVTPMLLRHSLRSMQLRSALCWYLLSGRFLANNRWSRRRPCSANQPRCRDDDSTKGFPCKLIYVPVDRCLTFLGRDQPVSSARSEQMLLGFAVFRADRLASALCRIASVWSLVIPSRSCEYVSYRMSQDQADPDVACTSTHREGVRS